PVYLSRDGTPYRRAIRAVSLPLFLQHTASSAIYSLPLHDALPISWLHTPRAARRASPSDGSADRRTPPRRPRPARGTQGCVSRGDRKSTRLNSSHGSISYAVFCLKKKRHHK